MSLCVRGGVTYRRHQWGKARFTTDNLVYTEFVICKKCGLDKTDLTGEVAAPEALGVVMGDEPTGTNQ